jgi:L-fucose isomerase-like protein
LFENAGISVETLDLSEALGRARRLQDDHPTVSTKLDAVRDYISTAGIPSDSLLKMAKLGVVIDDWMKDQQLVASAIQCWTSMQEFFGIVPCTLMSMMSNSLVPSACETDIAGAVAMASLAMASGEPSAIVDWNNNYGDDPNKGVIFHCSNLPGDIFLGHETVDPDDIAAMDYQEIIASVMDKGNTYGTIVGRVKPSPFTYLRISTDDLKGKIVAYIGEGKLTDDPLKTFGGYGVVEVPDLQGLLNYICTKGFEHHVSINLSEVADAVYEALTKYLGWEVYYHLVS